MNICGRNQPDSETANVIYVVDENGKLIEDIPVRRLVLNDPAKKDRGNHGPVLCNAECE